MHIDENIRLPLRVSNSHELTNFLYRKGLDKLPVIVTEPSGYSPEVNKDKVCFEGTVNIRISESREAGRSGRTPEEELESEL